MLVPASFLPWGRCIEKQHWRAANRQYSFFFPFRLRINLVYRLNPLVQPLTKRSSDLYIHGHRNFNVSYHSVSPHSFVLKFIAEFAVLNRNGYLLGDSRSFTVEGHCDVKVTIHSAPHAISMNRAEVVALDEVKLDLVWSGLVCRRWWAAHSGIFLACPNGEILKLEQFSGSWEDPLIGG